MSALTTKKIPKNSGHSDFKINDGIESGPVALCMF
jgi:hypothetical protein